MFSLFLAAQAIDAITWATVLVPGGIVLFIVWLCSESIRQNYRNRTKELEAIIRRNPDIFEEKTNAR